MSSIYKFMEVGILGFMLYPKIAQGEGPILESLEKIANDDFFTAIEIASINDPETRKKAGRMLEASHLRVAYCCQPKILENKLDLNSADPRARRNAVEAIKKSVEEAAYMGARAVEVLSGPHPGKEKESAAQELLADSLIELAEFSGKHDLTLELETFDFDVDKKSLIGPSRAAQDIAEKVRKNCDNFGILLDLSHIPLQHESIEHALETSRHCLTHLHIGNCVIGQRDHIAYGDKHPRFGIVGGENDISQVRDFLRRSVDLGILNSTKKKMVSFEIKPLPDETADTTLCNAKRVLTQAWAETGF
jgi:sugar phosphate isomerase/epimerase